jgi:hypothetical protein
LSADLFGKNCADDSFLYTLFTLFREFKRRMLMKNTWKAALVSCTIAASIIYGEMLTAESNVFTFPPITAVAAKLSPSQQSYFKQTGLHAYSRSITFSWAFPGQSTSKSGSITVYSLLGQVVTKIPVQKSAGTAIWQIPSSRCKSGIYIARIGYSGHFQNLKLMLWN